MLPFFPSYNSGHLDSENNHGKPHHFAIPAIPRPGFFYIATMGVEEKNREKYDLSSVMDDAVWKNQEICMKQTEGLWRLATKSGNIWFVSLTSCISYCNDSATWLPTYSFIEFILNFHQSSQKGPAINIPTRSRMWEGPGKTKGLSHVSAMTRPVLGLSGDGKIPMTISQWVEKIKPMGCIFILSRFCHPLDNTCIMQYHRCTYSVSIVYHIYIYSVYTCMHVFHCFSTFLRFERPNVPALFFQSAIACHTLMTS